jgi:long-chain acyl-CoA synthetase
VLSGEGLIRNAIGKLIAVPQSPDDIRLTVLPLSHAYARTCDLTTWLISGSTLAAGDGFAAIKTLGPIVRPTLMNAVPYLIDKILSSPSSLGLDRLRALGCGGAALTLEQFRQLTESGITPIQGYGLTETSPVICSASISDARPGVVGRPIVDTTIRIGAGEEIQCRGPGIMLGYFDDEVASKTRWSKDSWFRTGDRGEIEADGMLKILGRLDDVIVLSTGRKFWPLELEHRLHQVRGVRHVIVRAFGTGLEALVDAEEGVELSELLPQFVSLQTGSDSQPSADNNDDPRILRVTAMEKSLTVESGGLTVKGTVRRSVICRAVSAKEA